MESVDFQSKLAIIQDFHRISRMYNKVSSALIAYETLYFNQWKTSIEQAKLGIKAHLLKIDEETNRISINSDHKYVNIWLKST
jgi:hypothetical protein